MNPRTSIFPWALLATALIGLALDPAAQSAARGQSTETSTETRKTYDEIEAQANRWARGGRRPEAIELLEEAVRDNPHHGDLRWSLGQLYVEVGRNDAALDAWNICRSQGYVGRGYLDFRVAELYARANRMDAGLDALEAAIRHGFLGRANRERLAQAEWPEAWRRDPRFERLTGLPSPTAERDRNGRWRFDLEFLRDRFRLAYPDLDLYGDEARFEAGFERLLEEVPELTDAEIPYHLQSICAGLHDAHCQVYFTDDMRSQFSLGVRIFEGRTIFHVAPRADPTLLGRELVAIEGMPLREVHGLGARFLSADNTVGLQVGLERLVAWPEGLRHVGVLAPDRQAATFTVRDSEGKLSTHRLPIEPTGSVREWTSAREHSPHPVPLHLSRLQSRQWFEVLGEDRLVYCQINQITEARRGDLGRFLDRLQRAIHGTPDVEALVLDLRYNGGGSSDFNPRIMAFLHSTPLLREPNGFFVFTGRRTASAAQKLVTDIEYATQAVIVGEPASSRPNFIGESLPEGLPYHPGVEVSVSTHYHQAGGGSNVDRRAWIPPDVAIPYTFEDYRDNVDPCLNWVRARLKE